MPFELAFPLNKKRKRSESLQIGVGGLTTNRFRVNQSIFMGGPKGAEKLETSYFNFGSYDWSLSVYSSGRSDSVLGESATKLIFTARYRRTRGLAVTISAGWGRLLSPLA